MSTRYFCDVCEGEIIIHADDMLVAHEVQVRGKLVRVYISHITPADGEDICKSCALDALAKLDDRPGVEK